MSLYIVSKDSLKDEKRFCALFVFQNFFKYINLLWWNSLGWNFLKFIYSEKATKFCEIFSEYMNFKKFQPSEFHQRTWRFRKILWPSQNIWTLAYLNEHGCILTASERDYIVVNGAKFILKSNCNYISLLWKLSMYFIPQYWKSKK